MGFIFSLIILYIIFKVFFFVGSGLLKLLFGIIGIAIILAILPLSIVFLIPIGIILVLLSVFVGMIQWIL